MKKKQDRLKRALQACVLELMEVGQRFGLSPRASIIVNQSLAELGWMPKEIDIDKVVAELTSEDCEDIKGNDESLRQGQGEGRDPLTTNGDTP